MKKSTAIRSTVAASVAAVGIAVGGVGLASADDGTVSSSPSSTAGEHRPGPGGGAGMFDVAALAEALGVTESELQEALEAVREELAPTDGDRSTPPDDAERDERQAELAGALAEELGLSAADVTTALDELHAAHEVEERTELSDRLDDAVDAGDLTAADKESVLKAFDAGVLRGGPGPR
jgi:hypothetical protein